ncbi:MAG: autotransporter assembly complex family protein [Syntrophotaleaceae bacterium]
MNIEGVSGEVLDNVKAALAFPPGLVQNGTVDQRWLNRFVDQAEERTRRALQPFGFYSASVKTVLSSTQEGNQVLTVQIEPGVPVRLSNVQTFVEGEGAERLREKKRLPEFPLKAGEVLHQGRYEEGKKAWLDTARTQGFLDAAFKVREIRVDPVKHSAEIRLVLETGPRYRFGEVAFSGAETYPEPFLRRYLAFEPGDVFSYADIGQSQLNYLDSDRFEQVRLLPDREAAEDHRIPVEVDLKSSPPKRLRPGIGYGTDTGARASLLFENLNLFHRGHELRLELNLSQLRQAATAAYILPDPDNLNSFTAFQAGYEAEDTDTFDTEKITVEAEHTRDFGRGRKGSVYLQYLWEDYTVGEQSDISTMLIPGVRFSQRRYREIIRPRKGYQYSLEVRGGHEYLLSDTNLLQVLAAGNVLLPLPARLSLFLRFEGGTTLQSDPLEDIPVSLRFFAGGDQSVRGYAYQSLGPEDENGDVIGGKHLLVGSIELERALFKNWGIAAFYDVGNAFNDFASYDVFQGAGLGARYYTPVGPVRLDLARQIGEDDPSYRIHLSIGFGW